MKLPSMTMMTTAVVWSVVWPFCAALLQTTLNNNDNINNGATDDASPPVISTSSGRIHGKIDPALPNVHQYLGIPYAVPPVGERRWTAPELLDQPDVDVQATQFRPSCMQFLTKLGNTLYTRDVLEFNVEGLNTTGAVSEDCLTLSVWTPANASANATTGYPVVIFIHGGAFAVGGQNVPYQIPAQWVDRDPHHLVVSFNYRLNIFGFPTAAGLRQQQQQNLGLLDQRAVVEWCRANVAAFGGDPARMVLWGNSAGAISADYYNFAHAADPLVTGFILDSGTALSPTPTGDTAFSNFSFVAAHVGCGGLGPAGPDDVEAAAAELRCMRGVPAQTIEDFVQEYRDSLAEPTILFHPSYDEVLVFSNYTARAEAGLQANLPTIVGGNAQDGVAFAPYDPNGPNTTYAAILDLALFFCPATETIRLRQQQTTPTARPPTYRYEYYGNWTNVSPRGWMGAYHAAELPMIMGTHPNFRRDKDTGTGTAMDTDTDMSTPAEYATSAAFQDAYAAFARDPARGLEGVGWAAYTVLGSTQVRGFGLEGVPVQNVQVGTYEGFCDGAGLKGG